MGKGWVVHQSVHFRMDKLLDISFNVFIIAHDDCAADIFKYRNFSVIVGLFLERLMVIYDLTMEGFKFDLAIGIISYHADKFPRTE